MPSWFAKDRSDEGAFAITEWRDGTGKPRGA
jgi:hypothetical protein